ncbi:MAG: pyocin knob domain-containing protein [Bacteroidales bacterium]|jgi:hypothetical protein|nr:pyocin knob domain-containing protein [Bacteroidales bacterium]
MAGVKISELESAVNINASDVFPIVSENVTKKATIGLLSTGIIPNLPLANGSNSGLVSGGDTDAIKFADGKGVFSGRKIPNGTDLRNFLYSNFPNEQKRGWWYFNQGVGTNISPQPNPPLVFDNMAVLFLFSGQNTPVLQTVGFIIAGIDKNSGKYRLLSYISNEGYKEYVNSEQLTEYLKTTADSGTITTDSNNKIIVKDKSIGVGKLANTQDVPNGVNLNNLTETGIYSLAGNSYVNFPNISGSIRTSVLKVSYISNEADGFPVIQELTTFSADSNVFNINYRIYYHNSWVNWKQIYPVVIDDGSITSAKIANGNVTTAKIANNAVTTEKIADGNITTTKIADNAITTAKISDSNITYAKLAANVIDDINAAQRKDVGVMDDTWAKNLLGFGNCPAALSAVEQANYATITINQSNEQTNTTIDGVKSLPVAYKGYNFIIQSIEQYYINIEIMDAHIEISTGATWRGNTITSFDDGSTYKRFKRGTYRIFPYVRGTSCFISVFPVDYLYGGIMLNTYNGNNLRGLHGSSGYGGFVRWTAGGTATHNIPIFFCTPKFLRNKQVILGNSGFQSSGTIGLVGTNLVLLPADSFWLPLINAGRMPFALPTQSINIVESWLAQMIYTPFNAAVAAGKVVSFPTPSTSHMTIPQTATKEQINSLCATVSGENTPCLLIAANTGGSAPITTYKQCNGIMGII